VRDDLLPSGDQKAILDRTYRARDMASALMDEHEGMSFITAFMMASDRVFGEDVWARVESGALEAEKALHLVGSYARMDLLLRANVAGRLSTDALFRLLPEAWVSSDPDDTDPRYLTLWREASKRFGGTIIDGPRLPSRGGVVPVWRGQDADDPWGIAWSLAHDVALRFARGASTRAPLRRPVIVHGAVKRGDVLAYLTARDEAEVIVDPEHVSVIDERYLVEGSK
jgi:hypothetical protein